MKQHKRDDPSAYVCDRCSRDFPTRKELRDHQRLPKEHMCDIADADAESGIDPQTATKLLSRKRASGTSPEVQWREIWNIVFPDDDDGDVRSYGECPTTSLYMRYTNNFRVHSCYRTLRSSSQIPESFRTAQTLPRRQDLQPRHARNPVYEILPMLR